MEGYILCWGAECGVVQVMPSCRYVDCRVCNAIEACTKAHRGTDEIRQCVAVIVCREASVSSFEGKAELAVEIPGYWKCRKLGYLQSGWTGLRQIMCTWQECSGNALYDCCYLYVTTNCCACSSWHCCLLGLVVKYFLTTLQLLPFGMKISSVWHFTFETSNSFFILQRPQS